MQEFWAIKREDNQYLSEYYTNDTRYLTCEDCWDEVPKFFSKEDCVEIMMALVRINSERSGFLCKVVKFVEVEA